MAPSGFRIPGALSLTLTCAAFGAAGGAAALAPAFQPRVGLWDQQLTVDDGSYAIPPTQMCVDAASAARMSLVGAQMDRTQCSVYRVARRAQGGLDFRSVCRLGGGAEATTQGEVTGDLQSHYVVHASGTTAGAAQPGRNGTHVVNLAATWRGPCPAGQTGGDMTTGGKTVNVFGPPR